MKAFLILAILPALTCFSKEVSVPFYLSGWDDELPEQLEYRFDQSDISTIDIDSFWEANSIKELKENAIAFLSEEFGKGNFKRVDPDAHELTLISFHVLGGSILEDLTDKADS